MKALTMSNHDEFDLIVQRCKDLPPAKGTYLESDYLTNLFLTVLDFRLHGTVVERRYPQKVCKQSGGVPSV